MKVKWVNQETLNSLRSHKKSKLNKRILMGITKLSNNPILHNLKTFLKINEFILFKSQFYEIIFNLSNL